MPQIYDMGPTALLFLRRKACGEFALLFEPFWLNARRTAAVKSCLLGTSACLDSLQHYTAIL